MAHALFTSNLQDAALVRRGKVRDIYQIDDGHLLIVATDRLSAFDQVLPTPIPGLDSLLSTVQMPPGVPVATVAIDGARNAALLAARILALKYPEIDIALQQAAKDDRARYDEATNKALADLSTT